MKTKNIFKTLAFAMMMPAMLLTTACSNEDELANNKNIDNTEAAINKGFSLPVTVNVTRQGDSDMRAVFNDETKKLSFSAGDQLFVSGWYSGKAGNFTGTLNYDAENENFNGTITTEILYSGTAEDLLDHANFATGYLLPNGYSPYNYLYLVGEGTSSYFDYNKSKAFATSKAAAVEQFSREAGPYSPGPEKGFTLSPQNAILNFTITGLAASTKVTATLSDGGSLTISGDVTPDGSGTATFAMALVAGIDLSTLSLTVGGTPITLVSSEKLTVAGKIYNINRAAPVATSLSELKTAINGGTDCSRYIGWEVNSAGAIAESGISGTKIGYVAYVSTSDVDADVSGSRILVIASADAAATTLTWGSKGTARGVEAVAGANDLKGYSNTNTLQGYGSEAHPAAYAAWNYSATIPSGGATPAHWFMPTRKQWENMRDAKGGTYGAMSTAYGISGHYWTSSEYLNGDYNECKNYAWRLVTNSNIQGNMKSLNFNVRSIFAY